MYPLMYRTATAHEEGEYIVTGDESAAEIEQLGLARRGAGDTLGERLFSVNTVSFHGTDGKVESVGGNEVRVIDGRREAVTSGQGLDWATAESLAFASLVDEGFPIRLSGQDSVRGTFSQRHSGVTDQTT